MAEFRETDFTAVGVHAKLYIQTNSGFRKDHHHGSSAVSAEETGRGTPPVEQFRDRFERVWAFARPHIPSLN